MVLFSLRLFLFGRLGTPILAIIENIDSGLGMSNFNKIDSGLGIASFDRNLRGLSARIQPGIFQDV